MRRTQSTNGKVGILVGGGPAPGINGVISAATIEAEHFGLPVIGFYDGFRPLSTSDDPRRVRLISRRTPDLEPLTDDPGIEVRETSRIDVEGGSILRTSRHNPKDEELERIVSTLETRGVKYLVTIGGDDTALSASRLADKAKEKGKDLRVAHVPKTIDNDLPLPGDMPTFGFRTACEVGAHLVRNLMVDSATMPRWFLVVAMGRTAGHLALGVGKGAGATLTIIPEDIEFGPPHEFVTADQVLDVIEAAIYKRLAMGRQDGVAVIAEGLVLKLQRGELERLTGINTFTYDEFDHVRLGDFDMAPVWLEHLKRRLEKRKIKLRLTAQNLGYILRCEPPNAFDREYVRELGYAAVRFLMKASPYEPYADLNGAMVYVEHGKLRLRRFDEMREIDPATGKKKVSVRMVDVNTEAYTVAREYMIRLEPEDLEDEDKVKRMAEAASMSVDEFRAQFGWIGRKIREFRSAGSMTH
jgi:6-phosphofructokinase 1